MDTFSVNEAKEQRRLERERQLSIMRSVALLSDIGPGAPGGSAQPTENRRSSAPLPVARNSSVDYYGETAGAPADAMPAGESGLEGTASTSSYRSNRSRGSLGAPRRSRSRDRSAELYKEAEGSIGGGHDGAKTLMIDGLDLDTTGETRQERPPRGNIEYARNFLWEDDVRNNSADLTDVNLGLGLQQGSSDRRNATGIALGAAAVASDPGPGLFANVGDGVRDLTDGVARLFNWGADPDPNQKLKVDFNENLAPRRPSGDPLDLAANLYDNPKAMVSKNMGGKPKSNKHDYGPEEPLTAGEAIMDFFSNVSWWLRDGAEFLGYVCASVCAFGIRHGWKILFLLASVVLVIGVTTSFSTRRDMWQHHAPDQSSGSIGSAEAPAVVPDVKPKAEDVADKEKIVAAVAPVVAAASVPKGRDQADKDKVTVVLPKEEEEPPAEDSADKEILEVEDKMKELETELDELEELKEELEKKDAKEGGGDAAEGKSARSSTAEVSSSRTNKKGSVVVPINDQRPAGNVLEGRAPADYCTLKKQCQVYTLRLESIQAAIQNPEEGMTDQELNNLLNQQEEVTKQKTDSCQKAEAHEADAQATLPDCGIDIISSAAETSMTNEETDYCASKKQCRFYMLRLEAIQAEIQNSDSMNTLHDVCNLDVKSAECKEASEAVQADQNLSSLVKEQAEVIKLKSDSCQKVKAHEANVQDQTIMLPSCSADVEEMKQKLASEAEGSRRKRLLRTE